MRVNPLFCCARELDGLPSVEASVQAEISRRRRYSVSRGCCSRRELLLCEHWAQHVHGHKREQSGRADADGAMPDESGPADRRPGKQQGQAQKEQQRKHDNAGVIFVQLPLGVESGAYSGLPAPGTSQL